MTFDDPFGRQQAFNANWATRMDTSRADADLCTQAESIAIGEARAYIVKDTSAVDIADEICRCFLWKNSIVRVPPTDVQYVRLSVTMASV